MGWTFEKGRSLLSLEYVLANAYLKIKKSSTLSGKKLNISILRFGTRQEFLLSPLLLNIVLEILACAARHWKELRGI
jgi:hypothetical protein